MVKSKRLFFIYLMFCIVPFSNCQSTKSISDFVGRYADDSFSDTKHDLRLLEDSSFMFIIKEGLSRDTIVGNWSIIESNKIILSPIKTRSYHTESKCDTCNGKFHIKTYALTDKYELTRPSVEIFNKGLLIKDGILNTFENTIMQNADSVKIKYFGFEPYVFVPQKTSGIVVNVFLKEAQQDVLQRDRILKIKKCKLITEKGLKLIKQH